MLKFRLGRVCATTAVSDYMKQNKAFAEFVSVCLKRYVEGDWGDLSSEDKRANDFAVVHGKDRILAAYNFPAPPMTNLFALPDCSDDKIWIVTEWDRSATTILFPSQY